VGFAALPALVRPRFASAGAAAPLLTGFRGTPALDVGAVARIASQLGQFIGAHPEIAEIDVNPLVVYPEQEGAVAVDALIVVR
jgi:hypothetical protein